MILVSTICFSQSKWESKKYDYTIEIPNGFIENTPYGTNVDFKAVNGASSIVIVIKTIPNNYSSYTLWDLLGNLDTFGAEWELGAKEYMRNPKFIKYGKTALSGLDSFWFDYTTDSPKLYSKNYQTKKGNKIYTITLTCPIEKYNYFSSIWYKFKNSIKLK